MNCMAQGLNVTVLTVDRLQMLVVGGWCVALSHDVNSLASEETNSILSCIVTYVHV